MFSKHSPLFHFPLVEDPKATNNPGLQPMAGLLGDLEIKLSFWSHWCLLRSALCPSRFKQNWYLTSFPGSCGKLLSSSLWPSRLIGVYVTPGHLWPVLASNELIQVLDHLAIPPCPFSTYYWTQLQFCHSLKNHRHEAAWERFLQKVGEQLWDFTSQGG